MKTSIRYAREKERERKIEGDKERERVVKGRERESEREKIERKNRFILFKVLLKYLIKSQ